MLSERQSVAAVGRQHGVNENQIYRWKEQFLAAGRQRLNGAKAQTADQRLDAENNQLKKLLGEKALEIEILKNIKHVRAHWDEILRLATSIKQGTVTASLMLRKLGSYPRQRPQPGDGRRCAVEHGLPGASGACAARQRPCRR